MPPSRVSRRSCSSSSAPSGKCGASSSKTMLTRRCTFSCCKENVHRLVNIVLLLDAPHFPEGAEEDEHERRETREGGILTTKGKGAAPGQLAQPGNTGAQHLPPRRWRAGEPLVSPEHAVPAAGSRALSAGDPAARGR